ncbi:MAG: putative Actinobacterial Holin-X, holin superfamily [Geobacteraceae bacterium]|nr:putative Actinobacterial Holin-X, holin superfamily [Geobacteraceae bacterium]
MKKMKDEKKSRSSFMLFLELMKDFLVFMNIEMGLAKAEVKRNIHCAKKGIILMAAGSFILILASLALVIAAIAALQTIFPLWLASLLAAAILVVCGAALLLTGKRRLKNSLLIPTHSIARVKSVVKKLAGQ